MSTILIVDDEPAVGHVIRLALARSGHQAVICADGEAALDALAACSFAIALIDLNLPRVGGLRVFEAVRATRPHLPVVVMSGAIPDADADLPASAHAPGIYLLPKPFKPKDLVPLVEMLVASGPDQGSPELDRNRPELALSTAVPTSSAAYPQPAQR
jgi:two-component system, OmpR family, response regulator